MRSVLICLLMFTLAAHAEDWATTDGKTYKDIKVLSHDDGFVTIMDSDGGATIPLRVLSPDLQAKFGYDAQKAAAREAALAAQDKADQAAVAAQQATQAAQAQKDADDALKRRSLWAPPGSFSPLISDTPFDGGLLQDGDFTQLANPWAGDGQVPRMYARANPLLLAQPLTCKGLIVRLDSFTWTRIYQVFSTKNAGTDYTVKVTYRVAPDAAFSSTNSDYANIGKHLNIAGLDSFATLTGMPGNFYGTIGDPAGSMMAMEVWSPMVGSNAVQTYTHSYPALPGSDTKTLVLAFPPGKGLVDILTVKVTAR